MSATGESASGATASVLNILQAESAALDSQTLVAAEKGDTARVVHLVEECKVDPNTRSGLDGFTPLHHACSRGHLLVARELLRLGARANTRDRSGETALHKAAFHAGNLNLLDLLIDHGAEVNAGNEDEETALFYASRKGYAACVRLLLQRGADAELESRFGETAVEQAADSQVEKAFALYAQQQQQKQQQQRTPQQRIRSEGKERPEVDDDDQDEDGARRGTGRRGHLGQLGYDALTHVCEYLAAPDLARFACVCSRWHQVTEQASLWDALGVRRWECALQTALGFNEATMASFRPTSSARSLKRSGSATSASSRSSSRPPSTSSSRAQSRQERKVPPSAMADMSLELL